MPDQSTSEHRPAWASWTVLPPESSRWATLAFLIALLLFICIVGVLEDFPFGDLIVTILLSFVLVTGVLAVGARSGTLSLAPVVVIPGLIAKWVNHFQPDIMPPAVHLAAAVVFLALAAVHFLRFIMQTPRVDAQVLQVGIATYLVLGLLWAFAYMLVAELVPDSFVFTMPRGGNATMGPFNALYFSFISLTTMGYVDIVPLGRAVRLLSMMEATAGVMYTTVLVARLVGLYSSVITIARDDDKDRSEPRPPR